MVYRLLPLGCFLAGVPVVDVAGVHVAVSAASAASLPGPLCFQRKRSRGRRVAARKPAATEEEAVSEVWVVWKTFFFVRERSASSACPLTQPRDIAQVHHQVPMLGYQVDILQPKRLEVLMRRRRASCVVFASGRVSPHAVRGRLRRSRFRRPFY